MKIETTAVQETTHSPSYSVEGQISVSVFFFFGGGSKIIFIFVYSNSFRYLNGILGQLLLVRKQKLISCLPFSDVTTL